VANSQGAFAFLTKPFEDEELISTIRDAALLKGTLAPPGESD
jgi:FixJ family two-component response regulator